MFQKSTRDLFLKCSKLEKQEGDNNNKLSGGKGGGVLPFSSWVQPPVEKETQKLSFWEQAKIDKESDDLFLKYSELEKCRCVPKIAFPGI